MSTPRRIPGLYRRGRIYWVKYSVNGRPVRESTGTDQWTEAKRVLDARKGRVAVGAPILPRADRVRYDDLAADLRQHYSTTGDRDLAEADRRLAHLTGFFRGRRAAAIGPSEVTAYVAHRQADGAANGTINRELGVLGRMLRLGYAAGKVLRLPVMGKLKEAAPRQGFFERDQYAAVRRHLPPDLQVAVDLAYTFGWRMRSEVLTLSRRHLDLDAGTLRLDPGMTKNDDGRVVYLPPDLTAVVAGQVERVRALERQMGRIIPDLFPHLSGPWMGQRRRNCRKAWRTATRHAGCPGRIRHDFRRTAVRNLVNAGVVEKVAMTVTGHKTRAVFDRYHIVAPGDLQDVARKLTGTISGTVAPSGGDARLGSA